MENFYLQLRRKQILQYAMSIALIFSLSPAFAEDNSVLYTKENLVSNLPGIAVTQDLSLLNPWGVSFAPGGAFWISDNNSGVSTLYNGAGSKVALTVTVPPPAKAAPGTVSAPTGQVANVTKGFVVTVGSNSAPAAFIFDTEDGTISAWSPTVNATNAILVIDNSAAGAVYKGLAFGTNSGGNFLFATNFNSGAIDVFDSNFKPVSLPAGSFQDPYLPRGYGPFGISNIDGDLFVTYAKQDAAKHDDVAGRGHGIVDVFDTAGHLVRRFAEGFVLNSPWGVALAPPGFGKFGGDILIGNFGDGYINIFSLNGEFKGQLGAKEFAPFKIDGLWALTFGGASDASPDVLYFTAGPNHESNGLFGSIQANRNAYRHPFYLE